MFPKNETEMTAEKNVEKRDEDSERIESRFPPLPCGPSCLSVYRMQHWTDSASHL